MEDLNAIMPWPAGIVMRIFTAPPLFPAPITFDVKVVHVMRKPLNLAEGRWKYETELPELNFRAENNSLVTMRTIIRQYIPNAVIVNDWD